jgi:hypothetical protein
MASYALFATRDSFTVSSSFIVPGKLTPFYADAFKTSEKQAATTLQILVPSMVAVFIHPPLHLYGLDLYNNPKATFGERMAFVKDFFPKTAIMRFCR